MDYVTNGGEIFYYLFIAGLLQNSVMAATAVFSCFAARKWATCVRASIIMLSLSQVTYLCTVTYARYTHVGKVCSGDYLVKPYTLETRD